jgi:hypothetical protein
VPQSAHTVILFSAQNASSENSVAIIAAVGSGNNGQTAR